MHIAFGVRSRDRNAVVGRSSRGDVERPVGGAVVPLAAVVMQVRDIGAVRHDAGKPRLGNGAGSRHVRTIRHAADYEYVVADPKPRIDLAFRIGINFICVITVDLDVRLLVRGETGNLHGIDLGAIGVYNVSSHACADACVVRRDGTAREHDLFRAEDLVHVRTIANRLRPRPRNRSHGAAADDNSDETVSLAAADAGAVCASRRLDDSA